MPVFKKVLIALDGSEFSEQALGLIRSVQGQDSDVSLLRVVTAGEAVSQAQEPEELIKAAQAYLEGMRARVEGGAEAIVTHADDPAEQILAEAERHDLVVLMTHGRGGVRRWMWGSVAERVVRHATKPLLLCNPKATSSQPDKVKRILVPLDGSAHAATLLELVGKLAKSIDAEVVLFTAAWVDPTDNALAYARETDSLRETLTADLEKHADSLRHAGARATTRVTLNYPAEAILAAAEQTHSDLIAMTTHGRTGLKRWFLGSVAEKVLRASTLPVLLVRIPPEQLR